MQGPFDLSLENMMFLPESPGAYILGLPPNTSVYIGRSDTDLRQRLTDHVPGRESNRKIARHSPSVFWFQQAPTALDAYKLEALWLAKYPHPANENRPAVPRR